MTYHQFDHLDEEMRNTLRALSEVAEKHFKISGDEAAGVGETIWVLWGSASNPFIDGPRDLAALERLNRALVETQNAISDDSMTGTTHFMLMAKLSEIDGNGRSLENSVSFFEERISQYRKAIDETRAEIKKSPFTRKSLKKINIEAIILVNACHFICEMRGFPVPLLDLNPASPFAYFLADVFQACNVIASPRAAFKAWVREGQRVHSSH